MEIYDLKKIEILVRGHEHYHCFWGDVPVAAKIPRSESALDYFASY